MALATCWWVRMASGRFEQGRDADMRFEISNEHSHAGLTFQISNFKSEIRRRRRRCHMKYERFEDLPV